VRRVSVAEPLIQASLLGEALDNGPALVFVADEDMRYVAVNARACDELGYTREELLQLRVTDIYREQDARSEYESMMREGSEGESTLTRKDGSTLTLRYVAGETISAGMQLYVCVGCLPA
jgi:PAS domain S-box-containing protein